MALQYQRNEVYGLSNECCEDGLQVGPRLVRGVTYQLVQCSRKALRKIYESATELVGGCITVECGMLLESLEAFGAEDIKSRRVVCDALGAVLGWLKKQMSVRFQKVVLGV